MNIERLQKQLEIDEGVVFKIYEDHLGYATFGIGHLITKDDLEYGLALETPVSEERVAEAFRNDVAISVSECRVLYNMWDTFPEEVQEILVNMMFNLGRPRLSKFKNMKKALDSRRLGHLPLSEGRDSLWYRQVGNRAERLMGRLEDVANS